MVQIDNVKMWESLIRISKEGDNLIGDREIGLALKDQGFRYDGEHIVPIEHENNNVTMEYDIKTGVLTLKNLSHAEAKALEIIYGAKRKSESRLPSFEESQGEQPTAIFYGLTNCTSEEKSELTEFEKLLVTIGQGLGGLRPEDYKSHCEYWATTHSKELLNIARKQITSEIDVDAVNGFDLENAIYRNTMGRHFDAKRFALDFYRKGIEDTIKKIKED